MRTTGSDLDSQSSQNRESSQRYAADQRRWHALDPGRRYGARRSPISEYISLHLSLMLTTNYVPLSRIKRERYFFYKEVCFVSLIEFRKSCLIKEIQHGVFVENAPGQRLPTICFFIILRNKYI